MPLDVFVGTAGLLMTAGAAFIAYLQLRRMPSKFTRKAPSLDVTGHATITELPRHNLPAREVFIGRRTEKLRILEGVASSYPVLTVEGLGGMGKTALVREVAWQFATRPAAPDSGPRAFDAIVWTEDHDGLLRLNDVLDTIASVLGLAYIPSLPSPDKYREVLLQLRSTACLLIIDNFETVVDLPLVDFITQVAGPPSKVIVTSRSHQFAAAWVVSVGKLGQVDGLELIRKEAQRLDYQSLVQASTPALLAINEATGGNPLAIRLAAAQVKTEGATVQDIVDSLERAGGTDIFKILFERTWSAILWHDEYARRILLALSLCARSASREALEAGSDVHGMCFGSAVSRLTGLSLVDVLDMGLDAAPRYQLHTLTRSFLRRQFEGAPELVFELRGRLMVYYLAFATAHADTYSDLEHIRSLDAERVNILDFAEAAYMDASRRNSDDRWRQVVQYSEAMSPYLWGRGFWLDLARLCDRALEAAQVLGDSAAASRQSALAGRIRLWLEDLPGAKERLALSDGFLSKNAADGDKAIAKRLRAQIASAEGDFELAEQLLTQILEVATMSTGDDGQAATLLELGLVAERRGRLRDARERYECALRLDERMATLEGQAVSIGHLGKVLLEMGELPAARDAFSRGLLLARKANRLSARGLCELGLARLNAHNGDRHQAAEYARLAERTYTQLGIPDMAAEARSILWRTLGPS